MKKATCKELGGACDFVLTGETPEQMGQASRDHVMDMMADGDEDHKAAVAKMMSMGKAAQMAWYKEFEAKFNELENV
jgi:hypothetical protein